jgi:hypothetical protein
MSATELRQRLIETIQATDDEQLLEEAYRLLHSGTDDTGIYQLNDKQKATIQEARQQIREGKYLSGEEADKEVDQWLSE